MATMQGVTTSSGVTITNCQAVEQLLETYWLPVEINYRVERTPGEEYEGTFNIWGYNSLRAYPAHDNGDPDHEYGLTTQEFLEALSQYITPDDALNIHCLEYIKCRHPAAGTAYEIELNTVKQATLEDGLKELSSE